MAKKLATVITSTSRFAMCESSCASTPSISCGSSRRHSPVVTATAACLGLRPVANAFGTSLSISAIRGFGRSAIAHRRSTMSWSSGAWLRSTIFAPAAASATLSAVQYFTAAQHALEAAGAKIVDRSQAPELHDMVERLCAMADLPKPRIALIDTDVPNAFATGRSPKHAAVAVTTGLWRRLEPQEIEGVLAHELSHIANRDVLVMTLASFFAMLAAMLTRFGLYAGMFGGGYGRRDSNNNQVPVWLIVMIVSIVTYALSFILIRMISRYREYAADRGSALITGAPEYLMSAL